MLFLIKNENDYSFSPINENDMGTVFQQKKMKMNLTFSNLELITVMCL